MLEAYLFASHTSQRPEDALAGALRAAGLGPRALAGITWLGQPPADLPGSFPILALPVDSFHFSLQTLLRLILSGERGLLAFGQNQSSESSCVLLGGPATVGRLNLLPHLRLHPAPFLPEDNASAADEFRLSLAPPPEPREPTPEDAPPIISPAAPPSEPLPIPPPPEIHLELSEEDAPPLYPHAARLNGAKGMPALLALVSALGAEQNWGALVTPAQRGALLTLVERF